ncbi:uncharacterized protein EV422DRAFT_286878 [Fimicolochytrium jonesii]|uniref:uncharacterized protein n=1 Tax=Fimicolochytrium jonesii TaxID=1396493 RepID=UPI0022FDEC52|nr:uncharacterized protein EV422DRAFT_286878 [Fimicolochytrium jonesii]KAI8816515.1 hypothetical protein EV422DRAFT_286878 [Fimicolochytrium jonesii]
MTDSPVPRFHSASAAHNVTTNSVAFPDPPIPMSSFRTSGRQGERHDKSMFPSRSTNARVSIPYLAADERQIHFHFPIHQTPCTHSEAAHRNNVTTKPLCLPDPPGLISPFRISGSHDHEERPHSSSTIKWPPTHSASAAHTKNAYTFHIRNQNSPNLRGIPQHTPRLPSRETKARSYPGVTVNAHLQSIRSYRRGGNLYSRFPSARERVLFMYAGRFLTKTPNQTCGEI